MTASVNCSDSHGDQPAALLPQFSFLLLPHFYSGSYFICIGCWLLKYRSQRELSSLDTVLVSDSCTKVALHSHQGNQVARRGLVARMWLLAVHCLEGLG